MQQLTQRGGWPSVVLKQTVEKLDVQQRLVALIGHRTRLVRLLLVLLVIVTSGTFVLLHYLAGPRTYADYGRQAISSMLADFYTHGYWKKCVSGCTTSNTDWGADSLSETLFLRWSLNHHDANMVGYLNKLAETAPTWRPPCRTLHGCTQPWSDQPLWDAVTLGHEYEATGRANLSMLFKEQAAFHVVDGADPSIYHLGACSSIPYQQPGGGPTRLKTLESTSNYIKAALLLYRFTQDGSYLRKAEAAYTAARQYFLDPVLPLYTVYVFDTGKSCYQVPGRFFASVNGNMIDNGLRLAQDTGEQTYRVEALATAQAVATYLSDANGVFADLQAENDIVEPLIAVMDEIATQGHQAFARKWLLAAASASASSLKPDGTYSRFFDGPPQVGTSTAWQSNGGYALAVAAASLDPNGTPATTSAWAWAGSFPLSITKASLPVSITFTGTGIALIGTLGERCCQAGHARVFIDGTEPVDTTGIWQNKSSSGVSLPNTVLFSWRWPSAGRHTIQLLPGIYDAKEGGSFIDISYSLTIS